MRGRVQFLLTVVCLWLAPLVLANDIAYIRCAGNQDRVWVYDSLSSFDVQAKLKCGEPVEILRRVKGFVMIRTGNGVEGYVPDTAFPDLQALPDEAAKPIATAVSRSAAAASASKSASAPVEDKKPTQPIVAAATQ